MAKFHFNLEVLLKHREDIEQRERDALFRAAYAYQVALGEKEQLENNRSYTTKEMAQKQKENTQFSELNWFHLYLNRLSHEIEECEKRIVELDAKLQAQKQTVIEATRKTKVLSLLKSKQEKEFIQALDKMEQKEVDEWITARYATLRIR